MLCVNLFALRLNLNELHLTLCNFARSSSLQLQNDQLDDNFDELDKTQKTNAQKETQRAAQLANELLDLGLRSFGDYLNHLTFVVDVHRDESVAPQILLVVHDVILHFGQLYAHVLSHCQQLGVA